MRYWIIPATVLSMGVTVITAVPAVAGGGSPLNLTGTWVGTVTYKGLDFSGEAFKLTQDVTLYMVTDGDGETAVEASAAPLPGVTPRGAGVSEGLCLLAIQAAGKPGKGLATGGVAAAAEAYMVYDEDLPIEGVNFKASKVEGDGGTLKGKGTVLPWDGPPTGTATIKLERTSSATPSLDSQLLSDCLVDVAP